MSFVVKGVPMPEGCNECMFKKTEMLATEGRDLFRYVVGCKLTPPEEENCFHTCSWGDANRFEFCPLEEI